MEKFNNTKFVELNEKELMETVGGNPLVLIGGSLVLTFIGGIATGYLVNKPATSSGGSGNGKSF